MRNDRVLNCKQCGKEFSGNWRSKYCSRKCQGAAKTSRAEDKSTLNTKMKRYYYRTRFSNWESSVTAEYLEDLWRAQDGKCAITGLEMLVEPTLKSKKIPEELRARKASLDRIDSSIGYVPGNVQFVCMAVQYAKNNMPNEVIKRFFKDFKDA